VGKQRAPRARKSSAKTSDRAKKRVSNPRSKAASPAEPSEADIRLRAYFIAERRVQMALQGDPSKDWLEAKRQLTEEAGRGDT